MIYVLLLLAGFIVSATHAYLVWKNKDGVRYSVSEHAIASKRSHVLYVSAHILTDVLFLLYAYIFFYDTHGQTLLFILTLVFVALDAVQSLLPSKGKTEPMHFAAAYVSWFMFQLVGVLSLAWLDITEPYRTIAICLLVPVIAMFVYMHVKRKKLWPLQLAMVPLYFMFLLFITIGSIT